MIKTSEFSFLKGWSQVRQKDVKEVKQKIMSVLNLKPDSRVAFSRRLNGYVEPKVSEAKAIEKIFAKYGIKDIWGSNDER